MAMVHKDRPAPNSNWRLRENRLMQTAQSAKSWFAKLSKLAKSGYPSADNYTRPNLSRNFETLSVHQYLIESKVNKLPLLLEVLLLTVKLLVTYLT